MIPGWDQGLLGVCKGEERHLVVPASLAYGDRGAGDVIPPHDVAQSSPSAARNHPGVTAGGDPAPDPDSPDPPQHEIASAHWQYEPPQSPLQSQ